MRRCPINWRRGRRAPAGFCAIGRARQKSVASRIHLPCPRVSQFFFGQRRSLDAVVEDCVNAVGIDVNTASAKLLARVSGVGKALAQAIVIHRETHGPFRNRATLKEVPRLGAKAFELSAGFTGSGPTSNPARGKRWGIS